MPARYRRAPGSFRRAPTRRKVTWAESLQTSAQNVAAGANLVPLDLLAGLESGGVGIIGGTIVRTHARVHVLGVAADTAPGFVWGLIVWDKTQSTHVPDPNADQYVDWMHHAYMTPGFYGPIVSTSTAIFYADRADVRAKRRLHEMNDSLFFSITNVGSQAIKVAYDFRIAVMLP